MGAVATKTIADLRRRRLQTAVLALVLFLASGAATIALSILVESHAPFDHAFARANGAHLVIDFNGSTSPAQLAATTTADRVTASAGPWPVARAAFRHPKGGLIDDQSVSGRPVPGGSIDAVTISAGRWWQVPGEIVLDQDTAVLLDKRTGDTIPVYPSVQRGAPAGGGKVPNGQAGPVLVLPGQDPPAPDAGPATTLTVVGIAASVSTPDVAAWMSPADVAALTLGTPPAQQMLYRVEPSTSAADLSAATASITRDLPAEGVVGTLTYLDTKANVDRTADLYVPILLAFSVFALLAAGFTIANVVSGIVLSSYRDIGVMKAVGFTPTQVTGILLAQIILPVTIGSIAGVIAGSLASRPTVEATARSFGLPGTFVFSVPAVVAVLAIAVTVVFLAAVGPAIHGGRLTTVEAITSGAPSMGANGGRLRRLGMRFPAAIPVRLGLAAGVAHPIRAAMTLGALVVGVAAVTFALGLNLSLLTVMKQLDRFETSPVRVELVDPSLNPGDVTTAILGLPETGRFVAIGQSQVTVPRIGAVPFVGYDGDASWLGYAVIRGRWFGGPGEVVAPTNFFRQTGAQLGDSIHVAGGQSITVRLVGEIFDSAREESRDNLVLRGAWADVVAVDDAARENRWEVQPKSGISAHDYRPLLAPAMGQRIAVFSADDTSTDDGFLLFLSVIAFMGSVLIVVSLGGVFDTVLLETRQRSREIAVLKALGFTPAQVVGMVVSSVVVVGLLAGLLGVPLGIVLQRAVLGYMGETAAKTAIPEVTFNVFGPLAIVGLALSGLAIAAVGAYLPAQRAARARIAPVLQAE